MFGWKQKFHDLEKSKDRQEKYFNDLLETSKNREDDLHKNYLKLSEQNADLDMQVAILEHQINFLTDMIGKMRVILGVEEVTDPESLETPQESCGDSSSSEASSSCSDA